MKSNPIQEKLKQYSNQTKQDETNALKEIFQEIALLSLSRSGFFKDAAFQGGSCLRIFYALDRFSEDLDFVLLKANDKFFWEPYLKKIVLEFDSFGLSLTAQDRSKSDNIVQKAFIKEDSFGQILTLEHQLLSSDPQKISIKLEVDTNPPAGATYENKILDFPAPFPVNTQDLCSLFSSKLHALLCREFIKGRDWFDFIWYVTKKTKLNWPLLESALNQSGPWQSKNISISQEWLADVLYEKIKAINWKLAANDVRPFLKGNALDSVQFWNTEYLLKFHEKLLAYL